MPDEILIFELMDDAVALPGVGETVDVSVRHQSTIKTPLVLGTSNGRAFQQFEIPSEEVLHNESQKTIRVFVAGIEWTEHELAFSGPSDQHFQVRWQENNRPLIIFGDDNSGAIPAASASISVVYAEGGGERGNKASEGTILQILSPPPRGYRLSVNNAEGMSGGSDRETYERARKRGPVFWASQDRAITSADYESIVLSIPGVAKVRAEPSGYSTVMLWVVPNGGGQASALMRAAITLALQDRLGTDVISIGIWDPELSNYRTVYYAQIEIGINLRVENFYSRTQVRNAVSVAINDWMSIENRSFGETPNGYLFLSDLYEVVENVEGVNSVDVYKFDRKTEAFWEQKTGNGMVTDITPTTSADNETWHVEFIDSNMFRVRGDQYGGQGLGFVDETFDASSGQFSFLVSSGSTAFQAGDSFWFKTSKRVSNIPLEPREFPALYTLTIIASGGY